VEREPGGDQGGDHYEESEISEASMQFFEVRDLLLTGLLALFVLFGGREIGRRHRGIIAYLCARPLVGYVVAGVASIVLVAATREYHFAESFMKRRCVGKSTKTMPKRCV
jgi:hypothetical protein